MNRGKCRGLLCVALAIGLLSCDKQVDWDLKYQEVDLLVVEGKITNEAGPHEIRLSTPVYKMNSSPDPVSGAVVEVNDGRDIYAFSEDSERPGIYLSPPGFSGEVNRYYQLRIQHGSRRISAVTHMVPGYPISAKCMSIRSRTILHFWERILMTAKYLPLFAWSWTGAMWMDMKTKLIRPPML